MSRTGSESRSTADRAVSGIGRALLSAGALPVYVAIRYGSEYAGAAGVAVVFVAAIGYLLAMVVFATQARLSYDGRTWLAAAAVALSVVTAFGLARSSSPGSIVSEIAILAMAPLIVGLAVRRFARFRSAYVLGLIVLTVCVVVRYWSEWPMIVGDLRFLAGEAMADGDASVLRSAGLPMLPLGQKYFRFVYEAAPFLPGLFTMSVVVQFSIGTLGFFYGVARRSVSSVSTLSFSRWKMPRPVVLVLLSVVLVHMIGSEGARIAADNVLLSLAIFYAVTGFAALDYVFQAKRVSIWIRVCVYIVIGIAHVYGLAAAAIIGIVDSLFGWRVSVPTKSKD